MDINDAVKIMNEHRWRERDDWKAGSRDLYDLHFVVSQPDGAEDIPWHEVHPEDAIAIASYLLIRDSAGDAALRNGERLYDLVRHQRAALHEEGLISDDEFVSLLENSGAVSRLESYDGMRRRLEEFAREDAALRTRVEELERRLGVAKEALTLAKQYGNFDPLSDQTIIRAIDTALAQLNAVADKEETADAVE